VIILSVDAPGKQTGAFAVYDNAQRCVREYGLIEFSLRRSESKDLALVAQKLDALYREYKPTMLVMEHPFIHIIAQFVGALKMWACRKRMLGCYMINPSQAQKLVFGAALRKNRMTRTGHVVSDSAWKKTQVMYYVRKKFHLPDTLTQHEADAIFYAVAVGEKMRRDDALAR
jgi:Holliday junction resolvasome RuvABC endonuclease subunit